MLSAPLGHHRPSVRWLSNFAEGPWTRARSSGHQSSRRTDKAGCAAGDELVHRAERVDWRAREHGVCKILQKHHLRKCRQFSMIPFQGTVSYQRLQAAQRDMVYAHHASITDARHDWCFPRPQGPFTMPGGITPSVPRILGS